MTREQILSSANDIVCKARDKEYGKVEDSFKNIASLWSAYKDIEFTPEDVAIMMILLKVARAKSGIYKADNFVDMVGYAACAGEIQSENLDKKGQVE